MKGTSREADNDIRDLSVNSRECIGKFRKWEVGAMGSEKRIFRISLW